jgi:hypothetical protein
MSTKPELCRYSREFVILRREHGLTFGAGTLVEIASLRAVSVGQADGRLKERRIRIEATLRVSAEVELVEAKCSVCETPTPAPDDDALWYLLENHDGARLVFPYPEEAAHVDGERDMWPVQGWGEVNGEVACGGCVKAAREAVAQLKQKRRRKP